jgi:outer membrane protein insertion porin family
MQAMHRRDGLTIRAAGLLVAALCCLAPPGAQAAAPPTGAKVNRVGQIYLIGSERTSQSVILRQVPLYPGQVLSYPDNPYKDILITVQEAPTGSLMFGVGVNSSSGLGGSIVINERNFDLVTVPMNFDELLCGPPCPGPGQE